MLLLVFFFNDTAPPEISTLSLHDALPICPPAAQSATSERPRPSRPARPLPNFVVRYQTSLRSQSRTGCSRSEEHTSELQSRQYLVCRLLLEKKKKPYQEARWLADSST